MTPGGFRSSYLLLGGTMRGILPLLPLLPLALAAGCDPDLDGLFDGIDDGKTSTPETEDTGEGSATTDDDPGPDAYTTGDNEQCVLLYGGNDRIRGPDEGLPLGNDRRTLQAWVRTRNRAEQIALSHGRPSPGQGFQLGTLDGKPMVRVGSGNAMVLGDIDLADDEWHHLAATYDGHIVAILVDGLLAGSGEIETDTIEGDVVAGNTPTGDLSKPWLGWLDDVRMFHALRTPQEIAADLDGIFVPEDDLVLWWDFEVGEAAGPGVWVEDLSGQGHDAVTGGGDDTPAFPACR